MGSVARFGGDEFAILLTDLKNEIDPLSVARRVRKLASEPFNIDEIKFEISMSVGLTTNNLEYEDPDELLRDADIAMYRAKESGKARVEMYDQEFHLDLMERLEKQDAVRKAVETNEFRLHYQPTVSMDSGRIIGHEALLRWHIPDRGIVLANQFIYILDTSNLLVSIDQWVLKEACRQTMKWQKAFPNLPPLHISVNLCSENFVDPKIVDHISAILEKTKLPPESLWIEITENVGLEFNDISLDILNQLQSMGIHLCLDDFGKGPSSLNYLVDLPIDTLKIDESIIGKIITVEESQKITNAVILLAKQLELKVVAEGIENEAQFSLLKTLGCDYAQGFLFGRAVLGDEVSNLLKRNPRWE
jgi:EAL domain-containing protein (putative c-di-GMP-specific phosphodiesterase class I)